MAPDVVNHSPLAGQAPGLEGFKQALGWMRGGVPDLTITIGAQVAEGDLVVTRWTGTGTHSGPLMGVPPTGRHVTVTGIDICRVVDDRIVEYWQELDTLGMLRQVGAVP
jgi:predicted ester cyclase